METIFSNYLIDLDTSNTNNEFADYEQFAEKYNEAKILCL